MRSLDAYAASIVETIAQPLVVVDGAMRVMGANRSFYRIFQVLPERSEGRLLYELGDHHWDIPEMRQWLDQVASDSGGGQEYTIEQRFPIIGPRTMLLTARRLRQREDQVPLIVIAMEDITSRQQVDETRRLRLAAASHDALNVLSNIVGYAQMLEDRDLPQPVVPRLVSLCATLGKIMRELLEHPDTESEQTTVALVSARSLIRERVEAIEWQCKEKGLQLRVDLPAEGCITTDPIKVTRILDNLLSNAVRYTPRGKVHIQGRLAATELAVSVRDTGVGIPADELGSVFDPYYRASTARELAPLGTGLGLFTVKRFCEQLGGTTRIESTPGVGTACMVTLPRYAPAS